MKKALVIPILLSLLLTVSCADKSTQSLSPTDTSSGTTAASSTEAGDVTDDVPELDFQGYEFRVLSRTDDARHSSIDRQDEVGEVLNDAIYQRNRNIEERFNFTLTEMLQGDQYYARSYILAGDDAFDMINARVTAALSFWQEGLIYTVEDIPYLDLTKPYWDHRLNQTLTLNGIQYTAINDINLVAYDYTHVVLFNKEMISSFALDDPYRLVADSKWTFDKMNDMMKVAISDVNGDQKMDNQDSYGFLSAGKSIPPCFWIAAGVTSISKDKNDHPYVSMNSEKFINVFNKVFEMMWDGGAWYVTQDGTNLPPEVIKMFSAGQSLFMDTNFFYIESLRNMQSDFGIVPYPKYDEAQENYLTRVEGYDPFVIPITNTNLERTGAIIEALACESRRTVIPAYYDVALKTKYARDEQSMQMLDLVFSTRVTDLGDTIWVDHIRDSVIRPMFLANNRNLVSKLEAIESSVNKSIDKIPKAD